MKLGPGPMSSSYQGYRQAPAVPSKEFHWIRCAEANVKMHYYECNITSAYFCHPNIAGDIARARVDAHHRVQGQS